MSDGAIEPRRVLALKAELTTNDFSGDIAWRAFLVRTRAKLPFDHLPNEASWQLAREAFLDAHREGQEAAQTERRGCTVRGSIRPQEMAWRTFAVRLHHRLGGKHAPSETAWQLLREAFLAGYREGYRSIHQAQPMH